MQNLYLFITIIKKSDSKEFLDFYLAHNVAPIYSTIGHGAATSETLSLLGLEQSEKVLMQSIVTTSKMYELKDALTSEMSLDLPNRGIALAVPLTSIASKKVLDHILTEQSTTTSENHHTSERKIEMELIITICIKGNSDKIMKVAREAGATGGTVIKAKGTASGSDMFFGMAISDEKEIIYIVSRKENKSDIMKAVASYTNEHGTHPLVFSLPVTETAGFRLLE
ncbi:MAG: P-II family nitrogen regulator [Clostridia bacterium]|nr:P-II family nitrogen regulator [Clostridia bacterium]